MSLSPRVLWVVGAGYVGQQLAVCEQRAGIRLHCLVKSAQTASKLTALGLSCCATDLDYTAIKAPNFPKGFRCIYLVPPSRSDIACRRVDNFLQILAAADPPSRLVLMSTSGVYGDCRGAWVDESWPCNPQTERARRRVALETTMQTWCDQYSVQLVILRVAGIYGPGRLPLMRLKSGTPMLCASESPYSNRIHLTDLIEVCHQALWSTTATGIYNVSDGLPSSMTDYFCKVAELAGIAAPAQLPLTKLKSQVSPEMLGYLRESRRLDTARLKQLGVKIQYRDLTAGIAASL